MINQKLGASGRIHDGGRGDIDPEVVIEGRDDFLHVDRSLLGILAEPVGGTDRLSGPHSAPCEIGAADLGPVISPSTVVDFRRAPKLAPDHDGHIIEHSARVQIVDQGAEALVQFGAVVSHEIKVLAVRVPSPVAEADHADARLDQSASDQKMVVAGRRSVELILVRFSIAVTFDDLGVLFAQVEGIEQFAAGQDIQGSLFKGIHPGHDAAGIDIAPHRVEAGQQPASIAQPIEAHVVQLHILHPRPIGFERGVGGAEKSCFAAMRPRDVLGSSRESDEGRDGGIDCSVQLGDSRADRRSAAEGFEVIGKPSAHALIRLVSILATDDRTDDSGFVHALGQLGKDLADLDPWNIGGDGAELPSNFGGSLGLNLPHILVGRTASEENIDKALVRISPASGVLGSKQIREGKAAHAETKRANRQKTTARQAAAKSIRTTQ